MTTTDKEHYITLNDATQFFPSVNGKLPHVTSIWRWCRFGLRGTKLAYTRAGNRICTTKAAVEQFLAALNDKDNVA